MNELIVIQLVQYHHSLMQLPEIQTRYAFFPLGLPIKPTFLKCNIMVWVYCY